MTLNSKHGAKKLKTKKPKIQKHEKPKHKKTKTQFYKKNRQKMQTYINRTEQNNDYTRIMHKIQFHSSFKCNGVMGILPYF